MSSSEVNINRLAIIFLLLYFIVLERHLQVKKALQRPEKLTAVFRTVNDSLVGLFSWQISDATPSQAPVTGFQFSWLEISNSRVNKAADTLVSQTLNLARVRSIRLILITARVLMNSQDGIWLYFYLDSLHPLRSHHDSVTDPRSFLFE